MHIAVRYGISKTTGRIELTFDEEVFPPSLDITKLTFYKGKQLSETTPPYAFPTAAEPDQTYSLNQRYQLFLSFSVYLRILVAL